MVVRSEDLKFTVVPLNMVPEIPHPKGGRESPLRTSLKELPRGGFLFVEGDHTVMRKCVSDMCSRIRRLSNGKKEFSLRAYTLADVEGLGVWRTDEDPNQAKKLTGVSVQWPNKDQMMAGK